MLKFIEQAIRLFNRQQLAGGGECQTVRKMFEKAGQSPWCGGGDDLFVEHLNKLKENAHFKREVTDNVENNSHMELDTGNRVEE